jgi:hypothetical protein
MKLMKFSWYNIASFQLQCTLLTFVFDFSAFKSCPQNFSFIRTDSKFQMNLAMVKVKKVNIADT